MRHCPLRRPPARSAHSRRRQPSPSTSIAAALVRYLARTSSAQRPAVTYTPAKSTDSSVATATRDPWNAWVFSVSANGNGNREENYSSLHVNARVAANRVTDAWKRRRHLNQRASTRLTPAVEYDLFPYKESTRRQLRCQYGVGIRGFNYYVVTAEVGSSSRSKRRDIATPSEHSAM